MRPYLIGESIRRSNNSLLYGNFFLLVGMACLTIYSSRYLVSFFHGPSVIGSHVLTATANPANLPEAWVTVGGVRAFRFGHKSKVENGETRIKESYTLLQVGGKLLLVRSFDTADRAELSYSGSLVPIPGELRHGLLDGFLANRPLMKRATLPYMLETTNFRARGYLGLLVGVPLFGVAFWNVERARKRTERFDRHPAAKALAVFGDAETIAQSIDSEAQSRGKTVGSVRLTPTWLLHHARGRLHIVRMADVAWIYRRVTDRRVHGMPDGKTYAAVICDRYGNRLIATGKEADIEPMLRAIHARLPHVAVGYNPERAAVYAHNPAALASDEGTHQASAPPASSPATV